MGWAFVFKLWQELIAIGSLREFENKMQGYNHDSILYMTEQETYIEFLHRWHLLSSSYMISQGNCRFEEYLFGVEVNFSFLETRLLNGITKTRLFKYTENFTTKKMTIFQIKNSDIFHISAQNINCGYSLEPPHRGGSNEYPQSMFLSRNNKNNVYPCKPQFYYIKVGFKGVKII